MTTKSPHRVVIPQDNAPHAEHIIRQMGREDCELVAHLVETESGFRASLDLAPDLIVSEYAVPRYGSLAAIPAARQHCPDIALSSCRAPSARMWPSIEDCFKTRT